MISRRGALSVISGSICSALSLLKSARAALWVPETNSPVAGQERASSVFTKSQMETIAALSETIIPTDAHSPGAKAAHVDVYVEGIIGASDSATKTFWVNGLAAISNLAKEHCGAEFSKCSPKQQEDILQKLSFRESQPETLEERFFVALKLATVDGYYNSAVGIHQDLQYQGNGVLLEFPGCTQLSHTPVGALESK